MYLASNLPKIKLCGYKNHILLPLAALVPSVCCASDEHVGALNHTAKHDSF